MDVSVMMYGIPEEMIVKEWYVPCSNADCAAHLGIALNQLAYAWLLLRRCGKIPPQARPKRMPKVIAKDYQPGTDENYDGRPRIPDRDLLLERLQQRGHDYAEGL